MNKNDQTAIDTLINQFYSVFDNRDGKRPDFDLLHKLMLDEVSIYKLNFDETDETGLSEVMDKTSFIRPREKLLVDGDIESFHEWETHAETNITGLLASRVSSYAKKGRLSGKVISGQGKKHFQLIKVSDQWRIASVIWQDESV